MFLIFETIHVTILTLHPTNGTHTHIALVTCIKSTLILMDAPHHENYLTTTKKELKSIYLLKTKSKEIKVTVLLCSLLFICIIPMKNNKNRFQSVALNLCYIRKKTIRKLLIYNMVRHIPAKATTIKNLKLNLIKLTS